MSGTRKAESVTDVKEEAHNRLLQNKRQTRFTENIGRVCIAQSDTIQGFVRQWIALSNLNFAGKDFQKKR